MNISTINHENIPINHSMKKIAYSAFKRIGIPDHKDEYYKHFSLYSIQKHSIDVNQNIKFLKHSEDELLIKNGNIVHAPKKSGITINAINFTSLYDESFADPFYQFNHASTNKVIHILVNSDTSLRLVHQLNKRAISPYRIAIYIANGANFILEERYNFSESYLNLQLYGIDVYVGQNASFTLNSLNHSSPSSATIATHKITVEKGGKFMCNPLLIGSGKALTRFLVNLKEDSHIDLKPLIIGQNDSNLGVISNVVHAGSNSKSSQEARYILDKNSIGIFDGTVTVLQHSPDSYIYQNAKGLLLDTSSSAKMVGKPHLLIYEDDVMASHGMSIGSLNPEELFYLKSRGISESEAKQFLLQSFIAPIVDTLKESDFYDEVVSETTNCLQKELQ